MMMKKSCILLALILALACVPAMAAQGDAILGNSQEDSLYFNYCFSVENTLYMATYNEIYTYRIGDADLKAYEYEMPQLPSGSYEVNSLPFADGDKVYAINLIVEYGEDVSFNGAQMVELSFKDDGTAVFGEARDVDWSKLVSQYEDGEYPIIPEALVGMGGRVFIRYYDDIGNHKVGVLDMTSGQFREVEALETAFTFLPYKDGTLLAELYDMETDQTAKLAAYDPATDSVETLGEFAVEDYSPLMGLAYDSAADAIYCVKAGEICPLDLQAGEIGAGLTDMPLEAYGSAPACILEGGYYAYCSNGVAIRNLDPAQKAQGRMKINDTFWNESITNAYYRFANANGDISMVLSREYSESAALLENMMNRDSSIDLYVINTSSAEFDALYNRGYLMDMDGSEKAKALAQRMYPSIRDRLSVDGKLVALPLSAYAWGLGINEKALNALGMKLEDVPGNWPEFLDFLSGLAGPMKNNEFVHLFYSGCSVTDARYDLLVAILEDYQRYLNHTDIGAGYNTELLRGLLNKLEQMDFEALGCTPDEEGETEFVDMMDDYSEDSVLLQTGTGCSIGNFYSEYVPVLLSVTPEATPYMEMDVTVLIINPYTQNPEAALAFVDEVVDNLPSALLYSIDPNLSEPIRGELNETTLKEAQEELNALRAEYESAPAEDKQSLEQDVRESEETLTYIEENLWDVSPKELEWYRAHDDDIIVGDFNWLYSEEAGEAQELLDQYHDGQLGIDELLSGIDSKVQMMLLEGI